MATPWSCPYIWPRAVRTAAEGSKVLSAGAVSLQVTALGLINAAGKTGAIPTGVQFALKGMSAPSVRFCFWLGCICFADLQALLHSAASLHGGTLQVMLGCQACLLGMARGCGRIAMVLINLSLQHAVS